MQVHEYKEDSKISEEKLENHAHEIFQIKENIDNLKTSAKSFQLRIATLEK